MRRATMNRTQADQHIEKHGGRIFLHKTGQLGYQPHLLSADNEIIARVIEDEPEAETTETAASNEETKMNDYRVYTKANNGRIIAETTVQADNLETAQRKAFRQAKKDGLIPNEKHNASYGTIGWVANGENQYRRGVVYGDRFKSRAYELHLEMIIATEAAQETAETDIQDVVDTVSQMASLKKHYTIGRIGNHFDFGLCKVVGFTTNRRNEVKLEIAVRTIDGLETITVDNDKVEIKGRIKPDEKEFISGYFTA